MTKIFSKTKVATLRKGKIVRPYLNEVRVDRATIWGNPYVIGPDGTRAEVIEKYEIYLKGTPKLMDQLHLLKGKTLYCWCHPLACHADVLARYADK